MSMEVNNDPEENVYLFHEPNQQESILRHLLDQSCPCGQASEDAEKILHDTQKRIENNIESLDYLRGISRLERDFVHLADKVVQTSLHLSHDCRNINREALDSARLNEEVGNSWEHITHLGYMLQTHVNHAKRYHLFHLELENLTRQVDELEAHVDDLKVHQAATESAINTFCKEIRQSLEFFVEAFMNWQKLNSQLSIVNPLHRRMPLLHGLHSGVLMASISLSSANGKVGRFLRAGTRVHVRANRPADLMHREWFLVDPSKGMEPGGMVIGSVPAAFVWLNSPETSPERAETDDVMVRREVEIRRSQSTSAIPRRLNNLVMVKDQDQMACHPESSQTLSNRKASEAMDIVRQKFDSLDRVHVMERRLIKDFVVKGCIALAFSPLRVDPSRK
ncbi:unnamed protein product [Hydatigera taeniaeformis]|uniref:SH3_10 domain-containing protein n=1 Tax=Hydatigena taeniaeformis TaxID=6205 RepID=A0A0R3WJD4_HYDTA|nr:unnamed protein product [Hydatigera taeniaeformis]